MQNVSQKYYWPMSMGRKFSNVLKSKLYVQITKTKGVKKQKNEKVKKNL